MKIGIISTRYAKALLAYTINHKAERCVFHFMWTLRENFQELPKLQEAMDSPVISRKVKYDLLLEASKRKNGDDPRECKEYIRFLKLILTQHRESYLHFICLRYMDLYRRHKKIGIGVLTTAVPVDKETEEKITKISSTILKMDMRLFTIINPAIDGGFIFDFEGYRLDASVASRINRIKQQFIDKNRRIV
ncbi:MAG: F0F1 ATP synthase subunit delta [Bacteroides sp.]|nr:F0F1 ATP synthase subunit delta [Bacteroides sp.]MDD2644604.1 F0F1 ATP synthase subunit delta [Bacteroides sp.]MDD4055057.1 F0F1 ATP synthase subunit delta [Bacteroides sp.]MDD4720568.1 F0F1 ATP synthase subunit delta [Bacteroides sp.]NLI63957.1 F0F1 ATP synthase subunit delta [Bacteroidales bacterium]